MTSSSPTTHDDRRPIRIVTARDLAEAVRGLRPDATACGIVISEAWCNAQMGEMGLTYATVDHDAIGAIADAVDTLA